MDDKPVNREGKKKENFQMPTPRPERKAALVSSQRPSGQFNGLVDEAEGKEVSKPPII